MLDLHHVVREKLTHGESFFPIHLILKSGKFKAIPEERGTSLSPIDCFKNSKNNANGSHE